ncbi:DEKNAAC105650 [Brettanomyces naardenensis]|uniref:O-acyltransferase n=1 Tax=Brettanomyces naardenensis TaxID=13370 RepID=A0A448YTQ2_BRENA|nr:DEKNAAC105650 [Brettanomyces naardenensis]
MNDEYDLSDMNIGDKASSSASSGRSFSEPPSSPIPEETDNVEQVEKSRTVELKRLKGPKLPKKRIVIEERFKKYSTLMDGRYKADGTFRGKFADLNFKPRESVFDKEVVYGSKFFGLYVAFWFGVAMLVLNIVIKYYRENGSIFRSSVVRIMMTDIWAIGITDLTMYLTSYFPVFLHTCVRLGWIKWDRTGLIIESLFEVWYLVFFGLFYANYRQYPWIGKIFLMLHSVVLLMKIHSFAFYNGYMWSIKIELDVSKAYLKKHENLDPLLREALEKSVEFSNFELGTQAQSIPFPENISFANYFEYSMFPVVVYEVSFPRTEKIRWGYLFGKVAGIFGTIFVMVAIAQNEMYPIVMKCFELHKATSFLYKAQNYPILLIEMVPPFLAMYMMVFFLIWELILNAIAELSRFADREFYRYWWNSTDWNEYARDWNVPVHKFLLRHVYHSTISAFHVRKTTATFATFLLSSLVHEVAMFVIFRKVRFYLLGLQMCQLPLVEISRSTMMERFPTASNAIFWFGILLGPSLLCTMYLVF